MPLMIDNAGNYIMPGRTRRELIVENFYATPINSNLLVTATPAGGATANSTGTLNGISAGRGAYRVTTTAAVGDKATLTLATAGAGVWSASAAAMLFEVNGLSYSNANVTLEIGIGDGNPNGARLIQAPGSTTASVVMNGTTTPIDYQLLHNDMVGDTWNLGLLLIPGQRELHILEAGEIAYTFTGDAYTHFRLLPAISITTADATARFFDVAQVKWTAFHN